MPAHLFSLLPELPQTTPLRMSLLLELEIWLMQFDPYSDFNAASLWAWDVNGTTRLARCGDALVVRFPDSGSYGAGGWSVLGAGNQRRAVDAVLDHGLAVDCRAELTRVPECVTSSLDATDFTVTIDRANADSLYELAAEADDRSAASPERERFAPLEHRDLPAVLALYEHWATTAPAPITDIDVGRRALERLVSASATFATVPTGTWLSDELIGFSVDQLLPDRWALAHFAGHDPSLEEAELAVACSRVEQLIAMGVEHLNGGRTLRPPKLRLSEQGQPAGFLNTATLTAEPAATRVLDLTQIEQQLASQPTADPVSEPLLRS